MLEHLLYDALSIGRPPSTGPSFNVYTPVFSSTSIAYCGTFRISGLAELLVRSDSIIHNLFKGIQQFILH